MKEPLFIRAIRGIRAIDGTVLISFCREVLCGSQTIWTFVLPMSFLIAIAGCQGQLSGDKAGAARMKVASSSESAALRVTTVTPQRKQIVRRTRQPGQVEAFQRAPLYAKVPGYVQRFLVDIGDAVQGPRYEGDEVVERGQVLAIVSIPVELAAAQVEQAVANVKVAEAQVPTAKAKLEQALADVDRTASAEEKARSEYERVLKLAENRSVNAKVVDENRNQLGAAKAASRDAAAKVDAAEAAIAESTANVEKAIADQLAARKRQRVAEAELARTRALAEYQRIEAPFDGTISERNLDQGHFVQPAGEAQAKPLFVVVRTNVVRVFVDVPEMESTMVDRGDPATVRVQSLFGREFAGEVARTAWALDSAGATRTLRTEIDVANDDGALRPGMYVYATIILDQRENALALPATAVRQHEGNASCFCVEDGKLAEKPITVGLSDGSDVEIVSGLAGDEAVVEKVNPSLSAGQPATAAPAEMGK
jgi:RND family efflux transporter MFP subunit